MDKEKVQKIDEKINQLKAQKQALLAREKEKERKTSKRGTSGREEKVSRELQKLFY